MFDKYKIILKTLSPVHIGTDEVLKPLEFYVGKEALYEIDPDIFLENLGKEELKEYFKLFEEADEKVVIKIFTFTQEKFEKLLKKLKDEKINAKIKKEFLKRLIKAQVEISAEFNQDFKDVLKNKIVIKKFEIYKTLKNNESIPYISGSSLKGSIRTAVLNFWCEWKKINKKDIENIYRKNLHKIKPEEIEALILEYLNEKKKINIPGDPFKYIKISDLKMVSSKNKIPTKIYYALNLHKLIKKKGPPQYLECIKPEVIFEGEMRIYKDPKNRVSLEVIKESLKNFYRKNLKKEKGIYENISKKYGCDVSDISFSEDSFLIRIGKHSGNEFVTIRNLKLSSEPTTCWFASDYKNPYSLIYPFGWAEINFIKI